MGSDLRLSLHRPCRDVSIHAPRMGSDRGDCLWFWAAICFNPRPPHGERHGMAGFTHQMECFNPRPPHGERLCCPERCRMKKLFQSTPPAWGATLLGHDQSFIKTFQSTPPAWGATTDMPRHHLGTAVSIHAPRMGSDVAHKLKIIQPHSFNPRPPHGERPYLTS